MTNPSAPDSTLVLLATVAVITTVIAYTAGSFITAYLFKLKSKKKKAVTITKTLPVIQRVSMKQLQYKFMLQMFKDIKKHSAIKIVKNDNGTVTATIVVLVDSEKA